MPSNAERPNGSEVSPNRAIIRRVMRFAFGLLCLRMLVAACDEIAKRLRTCSLRVTSTDYRERANRLAAAGVERGRLSTFRYNIYVDNAANEIQDVSCAAAGGAFACSGKLPSMSPGRHVLELSTFLDSGTRAESSRSTALTVNVGQPLMAGGSTAPTTIVTAMASVSPWRADSGPRRPDRLRGCRRRPHLHRRAAGWIRVFRDGRLQPAVSSSTTSWQAVAADCSRSRSIPISREPATSLRPIRPTVAFVLFATARRRHARREGYAARWRRRDAGHSVGDPSIRARRQAVPRSRPLGRSVASGRSGVVQRQGPSTEP